MSHSRVVQLFNTECFSMPRQRCSARHSNDNCWLRHVMITAARGACELYMGLANSYHFRMFLNVSDPRASMFTIHGSVTHPVRIFIWMSKKNL